MGDLLMFGESLLIFVVSIAILAVVYTLISSKAAGIGWVHWKGFVLMGVGALYLIFGFVLTRIHR